MVHRAGVERHSIVLSQHRQSGISHRARGHVATEDFHAVQVNDHAIIPLQPDQQVGVGEDIGNIEGMAEVVGDVRFAKAVRAGEERSFIILRRPRAEPELGHAIRPAGIIKRPRPPRDACVRAGIEIAPDGSGGDQGGLRGQRDFSKTEK